MPGASRSELLWHLLAFALVAFSAGGESLVGCGGSNGPSLCGRAGDDCTDHGECCSFACAGGSCQCAPPGVPCGLDEACCSGSFCNDGTCAAGCRAEGNGCSIDSDCCEGGCEGVVPVCGAPRCNEEGARCGESGDCCGALACRDGRCAAICGTAGATCETDGDCCSGFDCPYGGGTCGAVCSSEGQFCDDAAGIECCPGSECNAGLCEPCAAQGFTCGGTADCCTGLACDASGVCSCSASGETCGGDGDCCDNLLCFGEACRCATFGERCTETDDCCSYAEACIDGQCRPTACRDTGSNCVAPADCCSAGCGADGKCCIPDAAACTYDSECCDSQVCLGDTGTCGACRALGAACGDTGDCCEGQCIGNVCRPTLGGACSDALLCVSPLECDTDATCCKPQGQLCTSPSDCCGTGLTCAGYSYNTTCCVPQDGFCGSTGQCCSGQGLVCAQGNCCKDVGALCTADAQCCSGTCTGVESGSGVCALSEPGERCVDYSDCAGAFGDNSCIDGTCCRNTMDPCVNDTDCCSGSCKANNTCN